MPEKTERRVLLAFVLPFGVFMGGLLLVSLVGWFENEDSPFWIKEPQYWVYPLQTLASAGVLAWYWRCYGFGPSRHLWLAVLVGIVVLLVWIAPQAFLGAQERLDGFDPTVMEGSPALYWLTLITRFARLVVVVPLLEEIFWRGFLLRYLVNENFDKIPFGSATLLSFSVVTVLGAAVHGMDDFAGAIVYGVAFNWLAIHTRSLLCCVVAHAVTNLGLGVYVMMSGQWGFW